MTHVALLGTGLLGTGFAQALLGRGVPLSVWNRSADKAAPLGALGAQVAATPADAVRGASRVHLVLTDDDAVDAVLAASLGALAPGACVIDHTTTLPERTAERAARLEREGVAFLHAPVFMSPGGARVAKGIMMVAGPTARFTALEADLAPMTGDLWHVGERADLAAAYKLFGNAMILAMCGALADCLGMADSLGLPRSEALTVFQRFQPSGIVQLRGPKMAALDFAPSFALEVARKDVRLMLESLGDAPSAVLAGLAARMDVLLAQGRGSDDVGVLAARER